MNMSISSGKFSSALWKQYRTGKVPVIPDIKVRSPQEGDLLQGRDPVDMARTLAAAGAPVISVVTEPKYFSGSPDMLRRIVQATALPVLRKDFINNQAQLRESVDLGASGVLLIASMLEQKQLFKLIEEAFEMGLEPLVETHSEAEISSLKDLNLTMVGINNRNIVELEMDDGSVNTTERLARLIDPQVLLISESSLSSATDVQRAVAAGAHAVLVGTAVLQAGNPAEKYRQLSNVEIKKS